MTEPLESLHLSGWSEFVRSDKRTRFEIVLKRWLSKGRAHDGDELISQHDLWLDPRWLVRELIPPPKDQRPIGSIAPWIVAQLCEELGEEAARQPVHVLAEEAELAGEAPDLLHAVESIQQALPHSALISIEPGKALYAWHLHAGGHGSLYRRGG